MWAHVNIFYSHVQKYRIVMGGEVRKEVIGVIAGGQEVVTGSRKCK